MGTTNSDPQATSFCWNCGAEGSSGRPKCTLCGKRLDLGPRGTLFLVFGLSLAAVVWRLIEGASPLLAMAAGSVVGAGVWGSFWFFRRNPRSLSLSPENWKMGTLICDHHRRGGDRWSSADPDGAWVQPRRGCRRNLCPRIPRGVVGTRPKARGVPVVQCSRYYGVSQLRDSGVAAAEVLRGLRLATQELTIS
jgi:hypothetical protein